MRQLVCLTMLSLCWIAIPIIADDTPRGGETHVLFDGSTLDGWRGRDDLWRVEGGAIVGTTNDESPIQANTFLISSTTVEGDFELTLQYQIEAGNSGIQYRSRVLDEEAFVVGGYQADIDSTGRFTGILYEEKGRGILATRGQEVVINAKGKKQPTTYAAADDLAKGIHAGEWNDYRIRVRDNRIEHFINEAMMVRVEDQQTEKAAKSGVIALQLHRGPAMTVRFRDLVLRML
ncbi:MAG: DUF1080 domain-containing protein [Planctomycetota bacterium]